MSRKDYVAMAEAIRYAREIFAANPTMTADKVIEIIEGGIADVFALDDHSFDRARFFAACVKAGA